MLWTFFLSLVTTLGLWTFSKDNEHIMPTVSAVLQAVLAWMFYLAITHSDLFKAAPMLHENGKGMNAGVFVYLIEIEFIDGVKQSYQGDVNLIR